MLTRQELADLRRASSQAIQLNDKRGLEYFAGWHGVPWGAPLARASTRRLILASDTWPISGRDRIIRLADDKQPWRDYGDGMHLRDRVQAVICAYERGLVAPGPPT